MKVKKITYRDKDDRFSLTVELELEGKEYFLIKDYEFSWSPVNNMSAYNVSRGQYPVNSHSSHKEIPNEDYKVSLAKAAVADFAVTMAFENYDKLDSLAK